jgi:hypothetical protein
MLVGMSERGPDSAGLAVFTATLPETYRKYSLYSGNQALNWADLARSFQDTFNTSATLDIHDNHAMLIAEQGAEQRAEPVKTWLKEQYPQLHLLAMGRTIDLYKDTGKPGAVSERYQFSALQGTHGVGHTRRVAEMRTLPEGVDQRSACRHPDWTGPDDLTIKIQELRELTDWEKPIYVKVGASRPFNDVKLAVHAGADVVVVDGMQGGTAATQQVFIEHVGIPTLAAVQQAVDALEDMNMKNTVQLIISGGVRTGADVAKALAMGSDAVSIGQGVLFALGCNSDTYFQSSTHHSAVEDYAKLGTAPGYCHHCHTGQCPVGITTQDKVLEQRLDPEVGARRVKNYLQTLNMELTTIARACGKQNVHHLEQEDLVALTIESAAMARLPLAGTNWIPGQLGNG